MQNEIGKKVDSLYGRMRELAEDCRVYLTAHPFFAFVIILEVCLAYGFHATHYSFHGDSLVTEYYSGTALISAGRFCAPLMHYLTGSMNFAPFWQTVVMGLVLAIAGLLWGMVYKKASGGQLTDNALFVFWAIMITFPIMYEQLTYPNITIALAYAVIPVVLQILMPLLQGYGAVRTRNVICAIILLTVCVDFYESFASVYLVGIVSVLLIRYLFEPEAQGQLIKYTLILLKLLAILVLAIVVDYVLSKLVCFAVCGTFDFWYTSNTKIYWGDLGIFDGAIWLIRNIFVHYILRGTQSFSWFLFNLSTFLFLIFTVSTCIKRKSALSCLFFIGLFVAAISLSIVIAIPAGDRTAQAIPVYVATVMLILSHYAFKQKSTALISCIVLVLLCLNQTLIINNYAVTNYERHEYETKILRQVGDDLNAFPVAEKPVVFIGSEEELELPDCLKYQKDDVMPLVTDIQKLIAIGWGAVIPDSFYGKMSTWYGSNDTIKDFDDLMDYSRNKSIIEIAFIRSTRDCHPWFETDIYPAMRRLGYNLMSVDLKTYESAEEYITTLPCYPNEGYIYEAEDMIIVHMSLN